MADFARLGFRVDTREVRSASGDLERFSRSSKTADQRAGGLSKTVGGPLKASLAGVGIGLVAREALQAAESFTRINNRLRLVTDGAEAYNAAQRAVFETAQATRQPLEEMATLYQRIARNQKELGLSGQEVVDITKTISETLVISGASAEASRAALVQLGQAFASGTLRGEELNSVLEQAPRLSQAIAEGMGVTVGQLRALGQEGTLSAQAVVAALQDQADAVAGDFGKVSATVSQGMTQVGNSFTQLVGTLNESTGATAAAAEGLGFISRGIDAITASFKAYREESQAIRDRESLVPRGLDDDLFRLGLESVRRFWIGLGELERQAGLSEDALDALGRDLERTLEPWELFGDVVGDSKARLQELRDAATDAKMEILEITRGGWEKRLEAARDLFEESHEQLNAMAEAAAAAERRFSRLRDELFPLEAQTRDLQDEWDFLNRELEGNARAAEFLDRWIDQNLMVSTSVQRIEEDVLDLGDAASDPRRNGADGFTETFEGAASRIADEFADLFASILEDGELTFEGLGDALRGTFSQALGAELSKQLNGMLADILPEGATSAQVFAGAGAGQFVGEAVTGRQTTGLGSLAGAVGGTFIPGIGTAVGAMLGGAAGGLLEGTLFGQDNNGNNPGRARVNVGTGVSSVFGVGRSFDQANVQGAQRAADFAQAVAQAIGGSMANLDIVVGANDSRVGSRRFAAGDEAGLIDAVFDSVVNQASELNQQLKQLLTGFSGTSDQLLTFAASISNIDRVTREAFSDRLMAAVERSNDTLMGAYQRQIFEIEALADSFDGSASAAAMLDEKLISSQNAALQLGLALDRISTTIEERFEDQAQSIRRAALSESELLDSLKSERNALFRSLTELSSPEELDRVTARIASLNAELFRLGPQGEQRADVFATFAERTNEVAQRQLERINDELLKTQRQQNAQLQSVLMDFADRQASAISNFSGAVTRFGALLSASEEVVG